MPTENKVDCPALHKRSSSYPFGDRVPRTVRMLKTVTADPMPGIGLAYIKGDAPVAKAGQTYPVWTNSHGAVTAIMEDGTRLGLRPAEFEVDTWHHLATEPGPQHAEPIAWMVGTAFWWTKEEAERDAAATGLPIVGLGPMTDPGEVERLQLEIEKLRLSLTLNDDALIQDGFVRIENRSLRDRLAEQDKLLREIKTARDWNGSYWALGKRIDTALSTSAEPSTLPDPLRCNECTHADCGKFDGPRQVECRAMADNACARPGASS